MLVASNRSQKEIFGYSWKIDRKAKEINPKFYVIEIVGMLLTGLQFFFFGRRSEKKIKPLPEPMTHP